MAGVQSGQPNGVGSQLKREPGSRGRARMWVRESRGQGTGDCHGKRGYRIANGKGLGFASHGFSNGKGCAISHAIGDRRRLTGTASPFSIGEPNPQIRGKFLIFEDEKISSLLRMPKFPHFWGCQNSSLLRMPKSESQKNRTVKLFTKIILFKVYIHLYASHSQKNQQVNTLTKIIYFYLYAPEYTRMHVSII